MSYKKYSKNEKVKFFIKNHRLLSNSAKITALGLSATKAEIIFNISSLGAFAIILENSFGDTGGKPSEPKFWKKSKYARGL